MKRSLILLVLMAAACRDQRPPAPTAEQSDQLNDAENLLDAQANDEKGPADRSTGPSNRSN